MILGGEGAIAVFFVERRSRFWVLMGRSLFDFLWKGDRDFEVLMGRSLFDFLGEAIVILGVEGRSLFDFLGEAIVILGVEGRSLFEYCKIKL